MIDDTIAAISTPPGENGIGIVRLSGPEAFKIADSVFVSKNRAKPSNFKSHTMHYGHIALNGMRIDEVLLSIMRSPATYTREDIVEINCHGGVVVLKQIFELVIAHGARIAEPGEFTKRAFLNGRIDLVQAEAVLDIISSRTDKSLKVAQRQLEGSSSKAIQEIRAKFISIMADIEADINFPDEDITPRKEEAIKKSLAEIEAGLTGLLASSDKGIILKQGLTVVICGKANVGKSSLMNALLRQERVIVTPVPGTTRDTIEEVINASGIPVKIVDTAGIMNTDDEVTKESIERSRKYIQGADLILLVLDSNDKLNRQDIDIINAVKDKKVLIAINKIDLPCVLKTDEIKNCLSDKKIIKISAKTGAGIKELEEAILQMFWQGQISTESIYLSNARHIDAAKRSLNFVQDAIKGLKENTGAEFILVDLRDAAEALGLITGEVFTEELLDEIFSKFCIGK